MLNETQVVPHGPVTVAGLFATLNEAHQAAEDYKRQWHPDGYGTVLVIRTYDEGGWLVNGYRSASCD